MSYKVPKKCPPVTHLAFMDDVIIFANGSASSLKTIMRLLELYQNDSDQLVNASKSCYMVHSQISMACQCVIKRLTKFSKKEFPTRYLGSPLFIDRSKEVYYAKLCWSNMDKVLSCKFRLLSLGGKLF